MMDDHKHCPFGHEHPQPFTMNNGMEYCGKCWHDDATLCAMIPCTTLVCDDAPLPTLEQVERQVITERFHHFQGRRKETAESLGIALRTLYDRVKLYGLDRKRTAANEKTPVLEKTGIAQPLNKP